MLSHQSLFFPGIKGIDAVIINPLLISNFTKLSLRKTKTDKKDAMTIARYLLAKRDSISRMPISQDIQELRDIARERESLCHMISANKTEIKRVLQTIFPELESICNIFTKVMRNFIDEFPSARLVKAARQRNIAKALKQPGAGTRLTFSPATIINAAKTSVATVSHAKELILQGKVSTLIHLEKRRDELTRVLTEYCKASMVEDLKILTSIDGINDGTATTFLAETGNIENFHSHKKLIAFAGIDPTVYQSGKFEGASRISKRGNRHLRRVIWIMTRSVINHNAKFKEYYKKRKGEGLPFKKAVFATSHKLMRVIFAMLSQKTYFEVNYV